MYPPTSEWMSAKPDMPPEIVPCSADTIPSYSSHDVVCEGKRVCFTLQQKCSWESAHGARLVLPPPGRRARRGSRRWDCGEIAGDRGRLRGDGTWSPSQKRVETPGEVVNAEREKKKSSSGPPGEPSTASRFTRAQSTAYLPE